MTVLCTGNSSNYNQIFYHESLGEYQRRLIKYITEKIKDNKCLGRKIRNLYNLV